MTATPGDQVSPDEAVVLQTVATLAAELARGASVGPVRLQSRLDDELGLDSLAIVELKSRLEEAFAVELPDRTLATADTPAAWLAAVHATRGRPTWRRPPLAPIRLSTEGDEGGPVGARTLLEALAWHVDRHPRRVHVRAVHLGATAAGRQDGEDREQEDELSYGALLEAAAALSEGLRETGVAPGSTVALMLPTNRSYFESFVGVLLAGAVPVPIYPPARPAGLEDHLRRQAGILRSARASVLIADAEVLRVARLLRTHVPSLRAVRTVDQLRAPPGGNRTAGGPDAVALVQYTSGSTGHPKGVVLTHGQLLANIRAMGEAAGASSRDIFVSWLPLYHDMGLIGAWLASLYFGFPLVVMPPLAFLARPARWLRAISSSGGTLSASPNFGYELCLNHVDDDQLAGVDLSSWRMAFNGAEPVSAETIERFSERFGRFGFRRGAMAPVYGLAEVGVGLCFPPSGRGPVVDVIDREVFNRSGRAVPAVGGKPVRRVVGCGSALPGYEVRVVDAADHALPERSEGHIECAGPSATVGYLHQERASRALHHGWWLDTGDLGYLVGGELYVTGRTKDLVIRAGRNLHPEDLEEAVGRLAGVRKGCVAAFASADPALGTERLVVVAESRVEDATARAELRTGIRRVSVELLGTPPDEVVLAPPGAVAKTSSGKIRRAATRERYETGRLERQRRPVRRQIAHFALAGLSARAALGVRSIVSRAYGVWAWTLVLLLAPATWLLVVGLPDRRRRWTVVRRVARFLARLSGVELSVQGHLDATRPVVIVANHQSFLDSMVLALCLEEVPTFAAGEVFAGQKVAGPFLRSLGCLFVRRDDPTTASEDVAALVGELRKGRSVALFPEGGLDSTAGLRAFHLGAFVAATTAGAAVVPIGLDGSRGVVPPGSRWPHRGRILVSIGTPISAEGSGFAAAVALRDRVRSALCVLSGEGDRLGTVARIGEET